MNKYRETLKINLIFVIYSKPRDMKKDDLLHEEQSRSQLNEPMAQYYSRLKVPVHIYKDIQVGIEQADKGLLIPMEDVLARYR